MKPFRRLCEKCNKLFYPTGRSTRYCEKCRKLVRSKNNKKVDYIKMKSEADKRKQILNKLKANKKE